VKRSLPDLGDVAEALEDRLEHVKLGDVTDAAFKGGVWASCILGTKFMLDLVPLEEMFEWAGNNQPMVKTALKSYWAFSLTGSGPLALVPLFSQLMDENRDEIRQLAVDAGLVYLYDNRTNLTPQMLVQFVIAAPEKVKTLFSNKEAEKQTAASSLAWWTGYRDGLIAEARRLGALDRHQLEEPYSDTETNMEHLRWIIDVEVPRANAFIREAQAAVDALKNAQVEYDEARKRVAEIVRWGVSLVVGTYLAGSMIYAQDTLLDSLQGAFNMFKIPFKGGV